MVSGKKLSYGVAAALLAAAAIGATSARAATFTVSDTTDGDYGTATFTFSSNTLTLVLTNTGSTTKQGADISGVEFQVNGATLVAMTSATATDGLWVTPYSTQYDVGGSILNGTKDAAGDNGRWNLVTLPNSSYPSVPAGTAAFALGGGQPSELITGTTINGGTQTDFDPYVYSEATFVFSLNNVGASPSVGDSNDAVTFLFGTSPDATPSSPTGGCTGDNCNTGSPGVPEPASLSVLGLGALSLMIRRRNRR